MSSVTKRITKRVVESASPGPRELFVWDTELKGFGVRILPSGVRTYLVQCRTPGGKQRRMTVGRHGPLTADQARREARQLLAAVERGDDPAGVVQQARTAPSVAELCDRYLQDHAREHKRPLSVEADERNIRNHVLPVLGRLKVAEVTRADIDRLKRSVRTGKTAVDSKLGPRARRIITGGAGAANRVLALVSKMMNLAEKWGLRPDGSNPCRHVEKFKENKRERYLTGDELARLGDALTEAEQAATELPSVIAAVRLLVLTGCRLSEILTLQWEYVDFEAAWMRLPESKTGAKTVHLNAPALAVLAGIERQEGSPWVIAGAKAGTHLVNLEKPWRRIRTKADIPDVRLHDLRHSFASVAVGLGEGLPMIGKLLGHTQVQTTARYAHLAADPVKQATERVGAAIAGAMMRNACEVVALKR
jgi:integrase